MEFSDLSFSTHPKEVRTHVGDPSPRIKTTHFGHFCPRFSFGCHSASDVVVAVAFCARVFKNLDGQLRLQDLDALSDVAD